MERRKFFSFNINSKQHCTITGAVIINDSRFRLFALKTKRHNIFAYSPHNVVNCARYIFKGKRRLNYFSRSIYISPFEFSGRPGSTFADE